MALYTELPNYKEAYRLVLNLFASSFAAMTAFGVSEMVKILQAGIYSLALISLTLCISGESSE